MAGSGRMVLGVIGLTLSILIIAQLLRPAAQTSVISFASRQETVASQHAGALPVRVPGTGLEIQALVQYEGPYWEDGTGDHVHNVAALMLYNPTQTDIVSAEVVLMRQEQAYTFTFSCLPAGERLLVPEKNRQPYFRGEVTGCRCTELITGALTPEDPTVTLRQSGMSGIVLENQTRRELETVRLYYKLYLSEEQMYVGGTTYEITAQDLPAGGRQEVTPDKFVWGYSAVVSIWTEQAQES